MAVCTSCGAELSANSEQPLCAKCGAAPSTASARSNTNARNSNALTAHLSAFPITSLLVGINVAVFIGIVSTGLRLVHPFSWSTFLAVVQHPAPDLLIRWGANYGPLTTSGPWWQWLRLLTNTFVHIGIVHLVVNMWALLNLGALAEYLFGRKTTLVTYLLTGIAGSVTSLAWHPQVPSAGASGAILGIAGALLVAFRFARLPLSKRVVRSTSASLLIFAAYILAYGIYTGQMDNAAHLGGLGAGLVFGLVLLVSNREKLSRREELQLSNAAALGLTLAVAVAAVIVGRAERYVAPLNRGETELRANNLPAAITDLRRAVTLRPKVVAPHLRLAEAYMRIGQASAAEAQLKEAVTIGPKDATAWRELGFLYLATRRPQEGVYAFGRATELEPKSAENEGGYAVALQMAQRLPEAIAAYQKALQLNPRFYGARYNLALAYLQSGKLDDAIASLKQYLDEQRADPQAWAALAEAYRQKGMMAEAQDAQQRAQALRPQRRNQE